MRSTTASSHIPERQRRNAVPIWQEVDGDLHGARLLLWLVGLPFPIAVLIWLFGGLH
jgi:hypothetical protein